MKKDIEKTITIITLDDYEGMRSASGMMTKKLEIDADQLAVNVNIFLSQLGEVVSKAPETVGNFKLSEIEVSAEITGKGQVVLWGVGGEVGGSGGIKFLFKKG